MNESLASEAARLDMDQVKVDPAWALRVPAQLATRRQVLPFARRGDTVHVACAAVDEATMQAVRRFVQMTVRAELAEHGSLQRALQRTYGNAASRGGGVTPLIRQKTIDARAASIDLDAEDAVGLCDELLHAAILRQASDIHIDAERDGVVVRFRVDGVLELYRELQPAALAGLISRYKVLSGMDIAEKRAPQDGGFKHAYGPAGQAIDIRTATLPTRHGERMTLRLLALQTESLTLEKLGMSPGDLLRFQWAIDQPHGMILLTGPTGSGKTTTLYAAMRRLIGPRDQNVITIEDPIEYEIAGVAQVEVDSADKVSFGRALRSVLRHDPDVLMIGEVRDAETADVAVKASLTGHTVLSTLHTNSAPGAVTRLVDLGVARYLIASTLRLVAAQRLVRRLCSHCRRPRPLTQAEAGALGRPGIAGRTAYERSGCLYCADRGYSGRVGLFEMIAIDEDWARRIAGGADKPELYEMMRRHGVPSLMDDAADKVVEGVTSVPEALTAVSAW